MPEAVTEATAKLHLDEETGEMVSKNELAKRTKKGAKKAGKAAAVLAKESSNDSPVKAPAAKPSHNEPRLDADAMFKQGFLISHDHEGMEVRLCEVLKRLHRIFGTYSRNRAKKPERRGWSAWGTSSA